MNAVPFVREEHTEIEILRFTRALVLVSSPFPLGGVCQLDAWEKKYPKWVKELRRSLYVDDRWAVAKPYWRLRHE